MCFDLVIEVIELFQAVEVAKLESGVVPPEVEIIIGFQFEAVGIYFREGSDVNAEEDLEKQGIALFNGHLKGRCIRC